MIQTQVDERKISHELRMTADGNLIQQLSRLLLILSRNPCLFEKFLHQFLIDRGSKDRSEKQVITCPFNMNVTVLQIRIDGTEFRVAVGGVDHKHSRRMIGQCLSQRGVDRLVVENQRNRNAGY